MKGKKALLIVIIILAVLLVTGGVFAYFKTDLFKSNEELFYKYFLAVDTKIDNQYMNEIENANALKATGDLSINLQTNLSEMAITEAILNGAKLNYEFASDNQANKQQMDLTLNFKDQEIANAKYLRDNDVYGLYLKDVLTKYLTIENNNLKDLATKLGVEDVSTIPDKIEFSLDSALIDEETKNYIIEKYEAVIKQNISEDKYLKEDTETTSNGTSIRCDKLIVSLTSQEIKNVIIELLKTLKDDDRTLDYIVEKVKTMYGQMLEEEIDKETLKENIQEEIDTLSQESSTNNDTINISAYVNDKKVIKHEITQNDNVVLSLEYSDNKVQLNLKQEENEMLVILTNETSDNTVTTTIDGEITTEGTTIPLKMTETMLKNNNIITDNITLEVTLDENNTVKLISNNQIEMLDTVEIESFTSDNSAKINDMSSEEIILLMQQFSTRIESVIENKTQELIESLTSSGTDENTETNSVTNAINLMSTQELEAFNSIYETYAGVGKSSTQVKALIQIVITGNQTSENKVSINNISDATQLQTYLSSIDDTKTYSIMLSYDAEGRVNNITIQ